MSNRPRYPQPVITTNRSDPRVVSAETPPVINVGANDTAAQIEYLRSKEKRIADGTALPRAALIPA